MSNSKHRPTQSEPPADYVTHAQLEESPQWITQSFQQQFMAFSKEFFARIQPQLPTFSATPPSLYAEATAESLSPGREGQECVAGATSRDPYCHHTAPGASANSAAPGYDRAFHPIAETIRGNTPLSDDIINAACEKFKMPHLDKYKGEGDPVEHVQNYYDMMSMLQASEAIICRCFTVTLTGSAKLWWNSSEKKSIHSFEQLSQKFVHHFLADTKQKLPPHVLIQMR